MDPRESDAAERIGKALKRLRERTTQTALAARLHLDQTTISRYELGKDLIPLSLVPEIEEALGLPKGALLIAAGFVEVVGDVPQAVFADPNPELLQVHREMILKIYPGKSGG